MADADEDFIPRSHPPSSTAASSASTSDPNHDLDLEDEAQDFRFLASLTASAKSKLAQSSSLPKRGEKDFEPNPTQAQSTVLHASREAMREALAVERVHPPRNQLVGQYLPHEKDWRRDLATDRVGAGGRCVVVQKFTTTFSRSMGVADWRNWTWLLPEEALFLLERGTVDVRWPDEATKEFEKDTDEGGDDAEPDHHTNTASIDGLLGDSDGEDDNGSTDEEAARKRGHGRVDRKSTPNPHRMHLHVGELPMSLQAAYASFIGKSGLTLERYNVYAGLRRLGYIVLRAPTWDDDIEEPASKPNGHLIAEAPPPSTSNHALTLTQSPTRRQTSWVATIVNRLVAYLHTPRPRQYNPSLGPLASPGIYRNYDDIFRALTLIPYHHHHHHHENHSPTNTSISRPLPPYTISFHVYKPSPNTQFRKSSPPAPDFRVCVLDARSTTIPTPAQLSSLFAHAVPDELPPDKRMETRLRHGVRNVVLAVVDCGIVSYLRAADVVSGENGRLFETKTARATKGGHRGGKRGGARGRGKR